MSADRKLLVSANGKLLVSDDGKLADKNCCCGPDFGACCYTNDEEPDFKHCCHQGTRDECSELGGTFQAGATCAGGSDQSIPFCKEGETPPCSSSCCACENVQCISGFSYAISVSGSYTIVPDASVNPICDENDLPVGCCRPSNTPPPCDDAAPCDGCHSWDGSFSLSSSKSATRIDIPIGPDGSCPFVLPDEGQVIIRNICTSSGECACRQTFINTMESSGAFAREEFCAGEVPYPGCVEGASEFDDWTCPCPCGQSYATANVAGFAESNNDLCDSTRFFIIVPQVFLTVVCGGKTIFNDVVSDPDNPITAQYTTPGEGPCGLQSQTWSGSIDLAPYLASYGSASSGELNYTMSINVS